MPKINDAWTERRRRLAMRPNAHLYIRNDAWRFMRPGAPRYSGRDVVKYFWPDPEDQRVEPAVATEPDIGRDHAFEREVQELRCLLASLKVELALQKLGTTYRKYSPNQSRVPAGSPDGGQWTGEGAASSRQPNRDDTRVRLAAAEKPPLGPKSKLAVALEIARRVIDAFRSENGLYDLFRNKTGVVTYTETDGKQYFGTNSRSFLFDSVDRADTERLRDRLLSNYPDRFESIGTPTNALYHAETNIMLRLARDNGGTLAGRKLEIFTDTPLCGNCRSVLPFVGKELGNPTVTFIGPNGRRDTMKDGTWVRED